MTDTEPKRYYYVSIVIPKGTTTRFRIDKRGRNLADAEKLIREVADRRFGEKLWTFDVKPFRIGHVQNL
jgi:hypothetical protein